MSRGAAVALAQEAQDYFNRGGGSSSYDFNRLDGNGDGIACSSLP